MRVLVCGAGYVGLTTAACLARLGHDTVCFDVDRERVALLAAGTVPLHEPGLEELVRQGLAGRLGFAAVIPGDLRPFDAVVICVGTPPREDGAADLSALWTLGAALAQRLAPGQLVLTKCTVPPGTNRRLAAELRGTGGRLPVVAAPEFLREGSAVADFLAPDRLVFGAATAEDAGAAERLFSAIAAPRLRTSWEGAELIKYASNAYLAVRVSFVNELARLCAAYGTDALEVARGVGLDRRIGTEYFAPGMGYGGSCLPKDVAALLHVARASGHELAVVAAAVRANDEQLDYLVGRLARAAGGLQGKRIAVWGLAFKAGTDDVRGSPALRLIDRLLAVGADVAAHDPLALDNARRQYEGASPVPAFCADAWEAAAGAQGVVVATDWPEYRSADLARLRRLVAAPVILDARNALDPAAAAGAGLCYLGVGREPREEG
jgi:UDPglucose 6-dehydrogenase